MYLNTCPYYDKGPNSVRNIFDIFGVIPLLNKKKSSALVLIKTVNSLD
jgi:hypothetical protein